MIRAAAVFRPHFTGDRQTKGGCPKGGSKQTARTGRAAREASSSKEKKQTGCNVRLSAIQPRRASCDILTFEARGCVTHLSKKGACLAPQAEQTFQREPNMWNNTPQSA